ncbi:Response regulator protein vraR [Alloiococcus otitis]|uniref:Response regulator receiver domain-containing protein n=1 Tax=Alloiococcus otitis ATCC 51267 TaxID=883081 RepID=K9EDX6_9LACT|nr:response regulator transcription factor [Alloiococcus otitis]EKU94096.1 hypothetical protein HMPREF9698_00408 [Alloiococcus otitis ATCC 51267]SUU80990.1 Response regulator protein vraR [Alloiococcus otitis]
MIKILLAEDQALVRESLKLMIEMDSDLKVTGLAQNGQEALELCRDQAFDLALLDIRMPVMTGLEAARTIRKKWPDLIILMLTTFNDEDYALEALKYGVRGYLLKDGEADRLTQSIKSAYKGGLVLEDQVAAKVLPQLIKQARPSQVKDQVKTGNLTERELQILTYLGRGLSNQEISQELFLSVGTVKNLVSTLLDKLELRDRTQLAIYAIHNNIT